MPASRLPLAVAALALLTVVSDLPAQEQGLRLAPQALAARHAPAPPPGETLAKSVQAPLARLAPAVEAERAKLEALALSNRGRALPAANGFVRDLPTLKRLELGRSATTRKAGALAGGELAALPDGRWLWRAEVEVAGAHRLRLHLSDLEAPVGTLFWVVGERGSVGPFGLELRSPAGDLWTPSIEGETARLEVLFPAGGERAGFLLDQVLELFPLAADGAPQTGLSVDKGLDTTCLRDAQCIGSATFDVIDLVQQGIAYLEFIDDCAPGNPGLETCICSGGLLNDRLQTGTPYFLTANHCISTQSVASTVEAFWDYYTPSCNGTDPLLSSLPRTLGASLLSTSAASDHTLLLLPSLPANRVFLGWNASTAAADDGTVLHRISHPLGEAQRYSRNAVKTPTSANDICGGAEPGDFLYEKYNTAAGGEGGTFGGSSGSPVIREPESAAEVAGQVVGQLTGACGPTATNQEGCNYVANSEVDGAFSRTYPDIAAYLENDTAGTCLESATTMCLLGGRFKVEVSFQTGPPANQSGPAQVVPLGSDSTGMLYFFNADNWEMLIKVLDACTLNNRFWVFFAATTNVGFTVTVTDTEPDPPVTKTYSNAIGTAALPVQDTNAFATCP